MINKYKIDENLRKITTTNMSTMSTSNTVTVTSSYSQTSRTVTTAGNFGRNTEYSSSFSGTPSTSIYNRALTANPPSYRSAFNDQPMAVYRSLNLKKSDSKNEVTDKKPKSRFSLFKSNEKIDKEKIAKEKQKEKERQKEVEKLKEKEIQKELEKQKEELKKKEKERQRELEKQKEELKKKEKQKEEERLKEKKKKEKESKETKSKNSAIVKNGFTIDARQISGPNAFIFNPDDLDRKLKVKVKKTGKLYGTENDKIPTYKTTSRYNRGKVLIINNIAFRDKYRHGADVDHENVTKLFKQMGFVVKDHKNKTKLGMEKIIGDFCGDNTFRNSDICVTIIMSHGNAMYNNTYIETIDNNTIEIESIVKSFSNSPYLANKPKIFIFQCCRGADHDTVQTDATPFQTPRNQADMLLAYATVPGFVSHRDTKLGTWYLQAICKIFMEHAHDTDIESLLKIVDDNLEKTYKTHRQTSSYENRGFKTCYLNPI